MPGLLSTGEPAQPTLAHWQGVPDAITLKSHHARQDCASVESGHFSIVARTNKNYAAAAKEAASSAPSPHLKAAPSDPSGAWTTSTRKRNRSPKQQTSGLRASNTVFLSQALFAEELAQKPPAVSGPALGFHVNVASKPAPSSVGANGHDSDHSLPSKASTLTNHTDGRSVRTLEECEQEIDQLQSVIQELSQAKTEADEARNNALMEKEAMQQQLALNEKTMQEHMAQTNVRTANLEQMVASLQASLTALTISASATLPPAIHRHPQLPPPDQTPHRSNVQQDSVTGGQSGGPPGSSPPIERPQKQLRPTDEAVDDDNDALMFDDPQAEKKGEPQSSGGEEKDKC
jgi:hypothetical protein